MRSIQRKKFEKNTPETDDIQNNYIDLPRFHKTFVGFRHQN